MLSVAVGLCSSFLQLLFSILSMLKQIQKLLYFCSVFWGALRSVVVVGRVAVVDVILVVVSRVAVADVILVAVVVALLVVSVVLLASACWLLSLGPLLPVGSASAASCRSLAWSW